MFVELLLESSVQMLIDVRTVPRSRTNPQYNRDALPAVLAPHGVTYMHIAALGGLRGRDRDTPPEVNGYWDNASFHNYADYALTPAFDVGLASLREQGHLRCCAVMCSEAVWWRCHRRIIADYLIAGGECVFHIMGSRKVDPAQLTPAAYITEDAKVVYPATGSR